MPEQAMRKGIKLEPALENEPKLSTKRPKHHHASSERRDRLKATCTVSARMRQVVEQMIACDSVQYQHALQQTTIFAFKSQQSEIISGFLQEMCRDNFTIYQNKEALMQLISDAYDKTQAIFLSNQESSSEPVESKSTNVRSPNSLRAKP